MLPEYKLQHGGATNGVFKQLMQSDAVMQAGDMKLNDQGHRGLRAFAAWAKCIRAVVGLALLAVFYASSALALPNLRIVTNTNDSGDGSLRQAIIDADSSNTDDTIVFQSAVTGSITLTGGVLVVEHSLSIEGPGASTLAVSGNNNSQIFSVDAGATVSISGVTIENGETINQGGGIFNSGTLMLTNTAISNNLAMDSGGIYNEGTLNLDGSTVFDNLADEDAGLGGGIRNHGMLTVTNSIISSNSASDGGGIFSDGTVAVDSSIITANEAMVGGGISNSGTLTVTNTTIFHNNAPNAGGGIINDGDLTAINCTLFSNGTSAGGFGGGGVNNEDVGTATFKNTIVAQSSAGNCASTGMFVSGGHNLSDDTTCFFTNFGDQNNTPAGLDSALKDNGGPTKTVALLAGSAAINAIPTAPTDYCTAVDSTTPIATDQRGVTRPQGAACDIGAFELVPSATPTVTATATPTPTVSATTTATTTPTATRTATSTATVTPTATQTPTATPTSTPTPVAGKLKVLPRKLNFGTVAVNQPKIKMVKVANAGKIKRKSQPLPISIEMESVSGMPSPSPFSVTMQCDEELQPKGKGAPVSETSCEVAVQFEPTDAISYKGTLTIFDNLASGGRQTVQLTGKGEARGEK